MSQIRFFTDEDVYASVAPQLRRRGFDAVSTPEVIRISLSDDLQLEWAVNERRTLVTFNVGHFAALHTSWLRQGRSHAGIIVSAQRPIGDILRSLVALASVQTAESMVDRLEFLSDW